MIVLLCFVLAVMASPFSRRAAWKSRTQRPGISWSCCGVRFEAACGLRTVIAYSWSICIAGFHRSWRPQSFSPRHSCVGIELVSATPSRHPAPGQHHICARSRRSSSQILQDIVFGTHRGYITDTFGYDFRKGQDASISQQSYYRWRKEHGGLEIDQARRMKDLERENVRLKRLGARFEGLGLGLPLTLSIRCYRWFSSIFTPISV